MTWQPWRRWPNLSQSRWLVIAVTLPLLQACSAIKLGYQQLPTLSYWWLDSAVSFNDAQTERAKEGLANLYQWHRSQELATYSDLLQRATELSQGKLQADQVCSAWGEARSMMDRSMRVAITQAVPVVQMLGPRQLSHLARHQDSKNEDWDKEWLQGSATERLERRVDKTLERYRSFYGELSAAQIALVKTQVSQSSWHPEWGRQERLRREQDLLSTLRQSALGNVPAAQIEANLFGVWMRWFTPPDDAGRAMVQKMTRQACDNLAQLHNTTSPEQRQRLARTLRNYERDIRELTRP
ncbi:hypothetical protein B9Z47_17510 [Limnohabitans sp. 2KL-1]|nr:hypothetical protein B9Z47_17510 [Limnohabitans sp. 2KL-1]